jgi:ABC-2 type transport system ATP-binding protein
VYFARLHGLPAADAAAAADRWIERLGLSERAADRVETLSLGNQQRVQLGVALVHDPEVLVLDEPFSGLDPTGVDVMSGVLSERAAEGVPVVFSSHQLELVERLCEDVAIIKGGRLVAHGAVEELRERGRGEVQQIRVRVEGDGDGGWVGAVPGAEVTGNGSQGLLVRLPGDSPTDGLLDAARAAGTVTHFSLERPSLSDLFRQAVAA